LEAFCLRDAQDARSLGACPESIKEAYEIEHGQIFPVGRNDKGKSRNNNGRMPIESVNAIDET